MFTDFTLQERVLHVLNNKGFSDPTPIQKATLPHALENRDILGQAQTGTGKTLAFALPIANRLEADGSKGRAPRAFILAPTRELALQVAGELEWVAPHLTVATVYGGTGYGKQAGQLKRGTDVVVATPGRALDYLQRNILDLSRVEIAVLDEADEMLSMGFEEEVETLLAATPGERQTMLFSATMPAWAKRLSQGHLKNPFHANVASSDEVTYEEIAIEATLEGRLDVLSDLLHTRSDARAIVFTRTKAETDALAQALQAKGHSAEAVHGDVTQDGRERVVSRFRSGETTVLVGTNVAARGLDIPEVDLVVHYRLPQESAVYQHRSGRTGRAGRKGTVMVLHGPRERRALERLERAVSRRFERALPPQPEAVQKAKLDGLLSRVVTRPEADKLVWREVAERWVNEGNADAIAGLLALTLGGAPERRSLLTGETGWLTVRLDGRVHNVAQVVRVLKDAGAGDVGRIQLGANGAWADIRPDALEGLRKTSLGDLGLSEAISVDAPVAPPKQERKRRSGSSRRVRSGADYRR